jgi:hypothetical protein
MNVIEAAGNVQFRQCPNNTCTGDFIRIMNSNVSQSWIGRIGGMQDLEISFWRQDVIIHELLHALGFWHEHQRPDRDNFVRIEWANIQQGLEDNFTLRTLAQARGYGPYDLGSIMHYGQCFFSSNPNCNQTGDRRTITVLPPNQTVWQWTIGTATGMSVSDRLALAMLYPPANWRFVDRSHAGVQQGNFRFPFRTVLTGINNTPSNGTLVIQPGVYAGPTTYNRPMTLIAPLGGVTLSR